MGADLGEKNQNISIGYKKHIQNCHGCHRQFLFVIGQFKKNPL
jgi:mono/diheme cytochrome c family protein